MQTRPHQRREISETMGRNPDQAETLLHTVNPEHGRHVKVISITSGKGGVGKTNAAANLGVALAGLGKKVMILDANLGLGNLDVLLGVSPRYNINDVIAGRKRIRDIVIQGPGGIRILASGSGLYDVTELSCRQKTDLITQMDELDDDIDFLLIDAGSGISENVMFFNTAAHEIIVVASPEPTTITDTYAQMAVMSQNHAQNRFQLLINSVTSEEEAKGVYKKLCNITDRFLNISLDYLGYILFDPDMTQAVRRQKAIVEILPESPASQCFRRIARGMAAAPSDMVSPKGSIQFFWKRLFQVA